MDGPLVIMLPTILRSLCRVHDAAGQEPGFVVNGELYAMLSRHGVVMHYVHEMQRFAFDALKNIGLDERLLCFPMTDINSKVISSALFLADFQDYFKNIL